ncbi:SDR family oxidoreductase [Candidatus Woesearchaeota archaeon]|nr:SDR family oxidoreductase [Candidatus Woesearchaeota archaeon]
MAGRLQGKVAIITGAGSGIGRAAAQLFAREGAGVAVADWDEKGGKQTAASIGRNALFVKADVSSSADARRIVDHTVKKFGKLDILYNNAGIVRYGTAADCSEEDWDKVMGVNLRGAWLCSKYAIPEMMKAGGGSVIMTSSIAGQVAFGNIAAYCASKGGLIQLARSIALDYASKKVRANVICPGVIRTGMTQDLLKDKKAMQPLLKSTIIGRLGEPEDIANAALYLASDESSFVTGSVIAVDGGWTVQ